MVDKDFIKLENLSLDELVGVVNLYPWFGTARRELCSRMSKIGGNEWGERDYATAALYVADRRKIYDILRAATVTDCSDKDIEKILQSFTSTKEEQSEKRRVRAVGGDFFSQDQYDAVKHEDDNVFASYASKTKSLEPRPKSEDAILEKFCTEALAQIYLEQGYYEQAKHIYSKLILRYPEKNAYFADLIEKLGHLTDN